MHADDLSNALETLNKHARRISLDAEELLDSVAEMPLSGSSPTSPVSKSASAARSRSGTLRGRGRSSSIVVFQPPEEHEGRETGSPRLPAVVVEDMTEEPDEYVNEDEEMEEAEAELEGGGDRKAIFKTARPPTELMVDL